MRERLTNLLPVNRQRTITREYFVRLGVIAAWLVTLLIVASGFLLIPTYVYLSANQSTKTSQLAGIESSLSSSDATSLAAQLAALSNDAATLSALKDMPAASTVIREMLSVARPGITLTGITYTPSGMGTPGTLAVIGTATTRDTLRAYQLALQSASFASAANLPVSAYAKNANLPFTITVTLSP
ncbi:MAG TPA: hypothetical protein VMV50_02230 [Candidatus Paceibacterota bacterium]|nr:hypothetical protein [Candidatus Paceibacterota bacterium]